MRVASVPAIFSSLVLLIAVSPSAALGQGDRAWRPAAVEGQFAGRIVAADQHALPTVVVGSPSAPTSASQAQS
jgi:hypothetical protein